MTTEAEPPDLDGEARHLARAWAGAVIGCCFVPMRRQEVENLLFQLGQQLLAAAAADPPDAEPARRAGAALVAAHLGDPAVLETTLTVLARHLPAGPGLTSIQGGLSAGYTRAVRERTLSEQEQLTRAIVDARAEAERVARRSEARFRAVFAGAAVGLAIVDTDGRIVEANQSLATMLGYEPAELRRLTVPTLRHPQDPPDFWEKYHRLIGGGLDHLRAEKGLHRRDGGDVWTELTISLVRDEHRRPQFAVAIINDVTDRHRLAARLAHMTMHDPLTGLANRAGFAERLAAAVIDPQHHRLGVCYLDLDGFKQLNDRLGHDIGDQVLVAVAERLHRCAADSGHLAARMGGDEFLVLVERSGGREQLTALAERIQAELAEPIEVGPHRLRITASIGVVEREVGDADPAEILQAADVALYRAKSDGHGRWALHDPERLARQVARYSLAAAIPDALERGEFYLAYQPIVAVPGLVLSGVEALVRWQHPQLGTVSPDQFIDLAEETGLIVPLGRHVLRSACRQVAAWHAEFPAADLFASVNIAAGQVRQPDFVAEVEEALADSGLKPDRLQLELTESTLMTTAGAPLEALRRLADSGVRVAIDDFGTGYSSLAYLQQLPVHTLKLAGPFVSGMDHTGTISPTNATIVSALIELARALRLGVTAEGVETRQQAERLRVLGCDHLQGWYTGRPVSPERLAELLREKPS